MSEIEPPVRLNIPEFGMVEYRAVPDGVTQKKFVEAVIIDVELDGYEVLAITRATDKPHPLGKIIDITLQLRFSA